MTKTRQSKSRRSQSFKDLPKLAGYFSRVSQARLARFSMYSVCVKASAAKCFEFNLATRDFQTSGTAFFAVSALRGICEDLIVLRFIGKLPLRDRGILLAALVQNELHTRVKQQDAFFSAFRPQQPVLRIRDVDKKIDDSISAASAIWNKYGWPNLTRKAMPPIREIAEKQSLHLLAILYDYFYRLTSIGVHFNVQSLLRLGWGPSQGSFAFSTKNFSGYFEDYCSLYGAFMLCLYFEFFAQVIKPGAKETAIVKSIREEILMRRRWPEMITFEEMNLKEPEEKGFLRQIVTAIQAVTRKRLVMRPVNYRKGRSAERATLKEVTKALKIGGRREIDRGSPRERRGR